MTDPVERSDELDTRLKTTPIIESLVHTAQVNRRLIKWIAVSVLFDVGLSIAFGVVAYSAHSAAKKATSAKNQALVNCRAANVSRKLQAQLWDYVLSFPPPLDETAAARKQRVEETIKFRGYIAKAFAPVNCNDVVRDAALVVPIPLPTPGLTPTPASKSVTGQQPPNNFAGDSGVPASDGSTRPTTAPSPQLTASPSSSHSSSPSPSASPSSLACVRTSVVDGCIMLPRRSSYILAMEWWRGYTG